jgi:hypothetical protein
MRLRCGVVKNAQRLPVLAARPQTNLIRSHSTFSICQPDHNNVTELDPRKVRRYFFRSVTLTRRKAL